MCMRKEHRAGRVSRAVVNAPQSIDKHAYSAVALYMSADCSAPKRRTLHPAPRASKTRRRQDDGQPPAFGRRPHPTTNTRFYYVSASHHITPCGKIWVALSEPNTPPAGVCLHLQALDPVSVTAVPHLIGGTREQVGGLDKGAGPDSFPFDLGIRSRANMPRASKIEPGKSMMVIYISVGQGGVFC